MTEEPNRTEPKPLRKIVYIGEAPPPTGPSNIGMTKFNLPDEATQRAGFEHEHALMILRTFPGYKLEKGKKRN